MANCRSATRNLFNGFGRAATLGNCHFFTSTSAPGLDRRGQQSGSTSTSVFCPHAMSFVSERFGPTCVVKPIKCTFGHRYGDVEIYLSVYMLDPLFYTVLY